MVNHLVREGDPLLFWNQLHEIQLDLLRRFGGRKIETPRDPKYMGVDDDSFGFSIGDSHNNIGGFTRDTGKLDQFFHRVRDSPVELIQYHAAGTLNAPGLISIKPGGANLSF